MDGIFTFRQFMEIIRKKVGLHMSYMFLEKAYDSVPREEVWLGLRQRVVSEKYVR